MSVPDEQLVAYESSSDREAAWVPLADWVHEQRPQLVGMQPPPFERATTHFEFVSRLARRAYLHWTSEYQASQFMFDSLLRHEACSLVDEVRVSAHWPGSRAVIFGRPMTFGSPPRTLLPALINAALSSAPPILRRFEVWIPKNPPWSDADDCRTQLEPLLRQRPRLAEQLVIRAPRRGLVEFLRTVADNHWRVITIAAPLTPADVKHLAETASWFPDVAFQLVHDTRREALANVAFVRDPDICTLEVRQGTGVTRGTTLPGRMLEAKLSEALQVLHVSFVTDLGMNALVPHPDVKRGNLKANGRLLLEPFFLRDGVVELEHAFGPDELLTTGTVRRIVTD